MNWTSHLIAVKCSWKSLIQSARKKSLASFYPEMALFWVDRKSPSAFWWRGGCPALWLFHLFLSFPQRHFCVFALSIPGQDALSRIYSTILMQHLTSGNFSGAVQKSAQQLISLALGLHQRVAAAFLPTAIKFHYIFNLRDFSNIFQVSAVVTGVGFAFVSLSSTCGGINSPAPLRKVFLLHWSRWRIFSGLLTVQTGEQ